MQRSVARSDLLVMALVVGSFASFASSKWVLNAARHHAEWTTTKGFLEITQAPRITAYPGVTAWLNQLMRQHCDSEPSADAKADCINVLRPGPIPTRLRPIEQFLQPSQSVAQAATLLDSKKAGRLCIAELVLHGHRYAASRPSMGSNCEALPADALIQQAIALLDARPVPARIVVEPFGSMEPVRAYVLAQDGSLVSRRFSDDQIERGRQGEEYQEHWRAAEKQALPAITAVNSFFPLTKSSGYTYTGTYIDASGLGVVSTGMSQVTLGDFGDAVVAIDVSFGTGWVESLALQRPRLLPLDVSTDKSLVPSWDWVASQASQRGASQLVQLVKQCPAQQRPFDRVATCTPNNDPQGGLLTATFIGISNQGPPSARWLIAWMPPLETSFELAQYLPAILLTIAVIAYALAQRKHRAFAADAATQWNGLLGSMSAGLIVIDPNTDRVRFCNSQAEREGVEVHGIFRDHVHGDYQPEYDRFNVPAGEGSRSYVVRLTALGGLSRWAVIRSTTAATALPILGARESDRVGIMMVLRSQEIELLRASMEFLREERLKLSALMGHGIAHLTRMMESEAKLTDPVRHELRKYLTRRVHVLANVLSAWALPHHAIESVSQEVRKQEVQNTLETLSSLACLVAEDRNLRSDLGWTNGVLSGLAAGMKPFKVDFERWPDDADLTTLLHGAETFIFEELLVNAFKHGNPGSQPTLTARVVRTECQWIEFELRNQKRSNRTSHADGYGGQRLVAEVCRRLQWELLPVEEDAETYVVRWRARSIKGEESRNEGLDL
jgi:hypothetical protein